MIDIVARYAKGARIFSGADLREANAYMRHLTQIGAIIGGECYADPDLNTPDQIQQGKVYFDFRFTPPYPAEHIVFRSTLTNEYLSTIFA